MGREVSTVLSAIVYHPDENGGEVLLKEVRGSSILDGFSLLGSDRIDWSKGATQGLTERIWDQHGIVVQPYAVNGIYQGISPSGKWIAANINFRATLDYPLGQIGKGLYWIRKEDIISGKIPVRTPDTIQALKDLDRNDPAELDLIYSPIDFISGRKSIGETESAPIGGCVIYNPIQREVLYVRRTKGNLLSPNGGKVEPKESIINATIGETLEESGLNMKSNLRGLISCMPKITPSGKVRTSFPLFAVTSFWDIEALRKKSGEDGDKPEIYTLDQLEKLSMNDVYTPDGILATTIGLRRFSSGEGFTPIDILREIRA